MRNRLAPGVDDHRDIERQRCSALHLREGHLQAIASRLRRRQLQIRRTGLRDPLVEERFQILSGNCLE